MSRPVWPTGHYVSGLSVHPSHFRGTTLRAAPSKRYACSTNYHACIAMPAWQWCAPSILFCPLPLYNLLPRLWLTSVFFVDSHWWVPLCMQCPAKAMPFQQIIMHALQCQHDTYNKTTQHIPMIWCTYLQSLEKIQQCMFELIRLGRLINIEAIW